MVGKLAENSYGCTYRPNGRTMGVAGKPHARFDERGKNGTVYRIMISVPFGMGSKPQKIVPGDPAPADPGRPPFTATVPT